MKAIFAFIIPTNIKIDLNVVTILQGKGKHCTIGVFFCYVCNKIKWYYERWRNPHVAGVQGPPRALEALAFFILNMHSPAFLSTL